VRCAIAFVALVSLPAVGAPGEPAADVFPPGWKQGYARSVEGRKLSYRWGYPGFAVSLLCRAVDATWAIEWEGEPAPAAPPDEAVTYVFHVGLNSGTSAHRFELQLDGRPLATFDTAGGTENRSWTLEGQDGARLRLLATRIGSFDERFGFMALTLPRARLGDGPPRFRIVPEAAGSQDYVLLFEEPVTEWAKVAAEEAVLEGGRRLLTADVSHLGPATPVVVRAAGNEVHRGELGTGHTRIEIGVPEGVRDSVRLEIEAGGRTLLDERVALLPVAARVFHLIPHSHVDIGYSDPQPEVERKQWANFRDALALFRQTRELPPEARFRWESEGLWAVESFLAQATEEERRDFTDAVARGDLELPANLTNVLTGLCHPEELARWTDASRRLKRRYGIETSPVAMHTDIPGLAWPTVAALAHAGVRYFSSGPNYMPNLKPDGGDRIGWTLVEHGDRPFWWVSPSGRERLLMWVAGRGYSWFHGANLGRTTDATTRGVLDYSRELTQSGYPYEIVQVRYTVGGDNGPVDPKLPEFVARWNERY
jgi:alpha-mannosidase